MSDVSRRRNLFTGATETLWVASNESDISLCVGSQAASRDRREIITVVFYHTLDFNKNLIYTDPTQQPLLPLTFQCIVISGSSISSWSDAPPRQRACVWNIKQQWNWTGALNCFEQMLRAFKCWIIHFGSASLSPLMPQLNAAGISLLCYYFS